MTEVTRGSCWHQNFVPGECLSLICGYLYLLNHEKMCIKSEFEDILFKLAAGAFFVCCLAHRGSTVGFRSLQCSVVLFDIPGIFSCQSQHVISVKSSSLFHHSIYLWFICFLWWSIDEWENLHADRTTVCFKLWQKPRTMLGSRKTCLSPPLF